MRSTFNGKSPKAANACTCSRSKHRQTATQHTNTQQRDATRARTSADSSTVATW
jgi:hypothetical protein